MTASDNVHLSRRQTLAAGLLAGATAVQLNRKGAIQASELVVGQQNERQAESNKSAAKSAAKSAKQEAAKMASFQIACMTLPYSQFSWARALQGIKAAGYRYVAWGTRHREGGKYQPVLAVDATADAARQKAAQCRDQGLRPLMMFSTVYPEASDGEKVLQSRIRQAAAAGIPQILTFGHTKGGNRKLWVERFKRLGPQAADAGVMIVVKQHGGSTGTGAACAAIVREVDHPAIRVNYDAGNVMDYLKVDPLPDIQACAPFVHSFCIKDHRDWPRDQDCGPGYGEIDHYRLLHPLAWSGRTVPLCCENIFAPLIPRPAQAEGVDQLASRARLYLETVVAGLKTTSA